MQALIFIAVTLMLFWVVILRPQHRRLRAHEQLVAGLEEGAEVVLAAGIHGRITELGAEDLMLEVAPGVELRVARQAVMRRIDSAALDAHPAATADAVVNSDSAGAATPTDDQRPAGSDAATPTDPA